MSYASSVLERRSLPQAMNVLELIAVAPFMLLSLIFVLLMLPVTVIAIPMQLWLRETSDAYCDSIIKLVAVAAFNAITLPAILAYAFWF